MCLVLWAWANVTSLFPSCSVSPVRLNPSCTVTAILSPRVRSWVKCEPVFPGSVAESKKEKRKKKLEKERKKKIITVLALYKVRLGNLKLLWVQPSHGAGTGKKCLPICWNVASVRLRDSHLWTALRFGQGKKSKRKDEAEKATAQLVPCQWRELVEETLKSSAQNQNKTPLFCSLK